MRPEIIATLRDNARQRFARCWRESIKRRPKRRPSVWAPNMRKMPLNSLLAQGRERFYDNDSAPHAVEIMDAADDESVRMIVNWSAVRDSKTAIFLNMLGRTVTDDPGGIFSVHPGDSDVAKFSNDDLEPMIDLSLSEYFVQRKSRDSGRTIDFKKFRGGSVRIVPYTAVTKFRGSTVKLLGMHEVDSLSDTRLLPFKESVYKAINRTTGMADAVIYMESTCTFAAEIDPEDGHKIYRSVIEEFYDKGDQRNWFCQCKHCSALNVVMFEHFHAPKGQMEKAEWVCPKCDGAQNEKDWRKMSAGGLWYPTAGLDSAQLADIERTHKHAKPKQPEIRSYWRNGFCSLLPKSKGFATKLHQFVAEAEAAKGSPEALKTWTNEVEAKLWSVSSASDAPPWKPMFERRENYGLIVPERGLWLTSFTDVHDNRLEVLWVAWGRNEESWVMDHVVLQGSVFQPHIWQLLRRELGRKFQHALGCDIGLGFGLIDGGDNAEEVYRFVVSLVQNPEPGVSGKVYASRGVGRHPHPIIGKYGSISKNLKGYPLGSWQAKKLLYTERFRFKPSDEVCEGQKRTEADPIWELLDKETGKWVPDPRFGIIHFNRHTEQEFFEQCVREKAVLEFEKGVEVMKFINPQKLRNEGLDLLYGNLAAVRRYKLAEDLLEADLRQRAADKARGSTGPKPAPARRRSSFVGSWR